MNASRFSVIVPTHNRVSLLKQTLESLFKQDYPNFEIIVVNDGSTDETDAFLTQLASEHAIRYVRQPNRGPAAARNAGIALAAGMYVACTDDDCRVPPDWLKRFAQVLDASGADIAGGTARNAAEGRFFSDFSQEMSNHFVVSLGKDRRDSAFLTSNNIAYRLEALRKAGCFDERIRRAGGEERLLNFRIIRNGGTSVVLPDLVIDHNHALTASGFFRQQRNYGRGAFVMYRVAGRELRAAPARIPLRVYAGLVREFLKSDAAGGMLKSALFAAGQAMSVLGYVLEAGTPRAEAQRAS